VGLENRQGNPFVRQERRFSLAVRAMVLSRDESSLFIANAYSLMVSLEYADGYGDREEIWHFDAYAFEKGLASSTDGSRLFAAIRDPTAS